jgi:hypothetical protein
MTVKKSTKKKYITLDELFSAIKEYLEEKATPEIIEETQDILLKHTLELEFTKFCTVNEVDSEIKEIVVKYLQDLKYKEGRTSELLNKYPLDDFIKDHVLEKALKQVCKENGLDLETEEAIRKQLKNRR